jgi:DNA-directed RNA polymerase subunit N (RpoN/RPB10)
MVLNRTWNFRNLHRIMCLALCLGVVCFALAGNAWAGTTSLASGVTVPSTYAQEATITPIRVTPIGQFVPQQYGNTYKLVNNASYSSDVYRNMGVTRTASQDFYVVVSLPANVFFSKRRSWTELPGRNDVQASASF